MVDDYVLQTVINCGEKHLLFDAKTPVLVMLSGGSDSTALAYIMHELEVKKHCGKVAALHVNHMLRGEDANEDARFVEKFCDCIGIPLFMVEVDVSALAATGNQNVEAVGRRERYSSAIDALHSLCAHVNVPYSWGRIATAHTLNDRAENFYMRSIVGTGPFGLSGIAHKSGNVIRPVLDLERSELQDFIVRCNENIAHKIADSEGNLWRSDSTNEETDRFRTYVRHEIMPLMQAKNSHHLQNLKRTMDNIYETNIFVDKHVSKCMTECIDLDEYSSVAQIKPLILEYDPYIVKLVVYKILSRLLGQDSRVDGASIDAVMKSISPDGVLVSGYVVNIQGNLLVSANKSGIRIEPADLFRARRNRI